MQRNYEIVRRLRRQRKEKEKTAQVRRAEKGK